MPEGGKVQQLMPLHGIGRLKPEGRVLVVSGSKLAAKLRDVLPDVSVLAGRADGYDFAPLAGRTAVADNEAMAQAILAAGALKAGVFEVRPVIQALESGADGPAVERAIRASARAVQLAQPPAPANSVDDVQPPAPGAPAEDVQPPAHAAPAEDVQQTAASPSAPVANGFSMRSTGLFFVEPDPEKDDILLSSPFQVLAETRDEAGGNWGVLIAWKDHDGREHEWAMPRAMLAGDGADYRRELLSGGLYIAPGRKARELLTSYLASVRVEARATCVSRTGWHGQVYVAAHRSFGAPDGERVLYQGGEVATEGTQRGTLDGWQSEVAALAVGNSRLAFSLSAAFAGPLLHLVGMESGGIHFKGGSSIGKTSGLQMAHSVWASGPLRTWNSTGNAIESTAAGANDGLLCLDEIGQASPLAIEAAAYMLANGAGKSRMRPNATGRPVATWRLIFLSTGEVGLVEKLNEIGRQVRAGQEVRILDVPADAGAGLGAFEQLHGSADGAAFANRIKQATAAHCVHAADAFLERITAGSLEELATAVRTGLERWVAAHVPRGADGQVQRAAARFALIAAAGELASASGILPWPADEAERAAAACFTAWLAERGGTGPAEARRGIGQVRAFLEAHGMSRFEPAWETDPYGNTQEVRTINRVGFRKKDREGRWEFYAMPEGFREMTKGFDPKKLAAELIKVGVLSPAGGGKSSKAVRVPSNGSMKLYHFPAEALASEVREGDDA